MRNPKRINEMLKIIKEIWTKNPDLRLMQLLLNAIGTEVRLCSTECGDDFCAYSQTIDHYNTEDDYVLSKLKEVYSNEIKPRNI